MNFTAHEIAVGKRMAKRAKMPAFRNLGGKRYLFFTDGLPKDAADHMKGVARNKYHLHARLVHANGLYYVYAR